jgi:transposase
MTEESPVSSRAERTMTEVAVMITIGVDAHKRIHVAVALDESGQEIGQWKGTNSIKGWSQLLEWAKALGSVRRWGIEGAWNYGRGLAQHLVEVEELVHEVNPRWTAFSRKYARKQDKNDRLDARSVALLVWREAATLPLIASDDETSVLDSLVSERESTLAEATRLRNQLHQLLLQLDPEYKLHLPNLQSKTALRALRSYAVASGSPLQQARASAVKRLAERLNLALEQVDELTEQIEKLAEERFLVLTELFGVSLLTAGALAGILGPGRRFKSDAQLAAYAGVAPLEASSAGAVRHRLNRGGNRRLNAILYRIALTQARGLPEAQAYLERKRGQGKTTREAFRALKRYIVRAIWRLWQQCQPAAQNAQGQVAA